MQRLFAARGLMQRVSEANKSSDFAAAVLACADCSAGIDDLGPLLVAEDLQASIRAAMEATLRVVEEALFLACADFAPRRYLGPLQTYLVLGEAKVRGGGGWGWGWGWGDEWVSV